MANQLEVEIVYDPIFGPQAVKKIEDQAEKGGKKAGDKFERGFERGTRGLSTALGGIKGQLLGIAAAAASAFAIRGITNSVSEIEKLETGLGILLGSTRLARETLGDLQGFAARTPFQLPGIADAANQLIVAGTGVEDLQDQLTVLGNVAAGTGKDFNEITQIFVQIQQEGKLTGERLRQLFERNIPIVRALAQEMGVAESQVRDLVSKGVVDLDKFNSAFRSLSDAGGIFAGSLEKQSQTVGGILSTLRDNFFNLQVEIGRTFGPAIIDTANAFIKIFQDFSANVAANGPQLVRTFQSLADIFIITPAKFWSDLLTGGGSNNIQEVNSEIARLEQEMAKVQTRIESTKDSFFAKIFGGREQALQDFGDIAARLTELKKLQKELTGATSEDTQAVKDNLKAQREARAEQERALALEKKREDIRNKLGNIGLTREQQIQQQGQKDLAALQNAREQEALTEEEYNARKVERERLLNEQLAETRKQEEERRKQALEEEQQQALDNEQTLADSLSRVSSQFKSVANEFKVTSKDIARALIRGIGVGAANAFASFGQALVNGENALKAFGVALLNAFGNTLVQLGTGFILQGVAQSLAGIGSGGPLIAAGAALATFGGVLQAISANAGSTGASAGGVGAGADLASGGSLGGDQTLIGDREREKPQTAISVNIQGDVLDSQESGLRIVELIENSFDVEGAKVTGNV